MNKLNEVQIEKLIEAIKENPLIFNKDDALYKQISMKEKIWKGIAETVGADEKHCKTAWKSLRDQFVKATKEMKSNPGQEATNKKVYKYYDRVLFLNESIGKRKWNSNSDQLTDESETMDLDIKAMLNVPEYAQSENTPNTSRTNNSSKESTSPSQKSVKKFKSSNEEDFSLKDFLSEILKEIKSPNEPQGDKDKFFSCLSSMVSSANLTRIQTRQLQRKIFNFVADELDKLEEYT